MNQSNENLKADFKKFDNVILSGSLVSWGKEWESSFDLAIFIRLDNEVRMKRLLKTEQEQYGEKLATNNKIKQNSKDFLA